jgi:hypothetical protein
MITACMLAAAFLVVTRTDLSAAGSDLGKDLQPQEQAVTTTG